MTRTLRIAFAVTPALLLAAGFWVTADDAAPPQDAKAALGWFNDVVGEWRGVGQVRRGSTRGAWREQGEFVWDFKGKTPAVTYVVDKGKHLARLHITYDPKSRTYPVAAILPDDSERKMTGRLEENTFVAESEPGEDGYVQRIVVTQLNPKRTLVRYERRKAGAKFAARLGEVGYTREGTRLASTGAGEPVCIVTGGRGTMLVKYEGKSYYVCCTGCRQAFEDDPAGIIAEYEAKVAAQKAAKKNGG